MLLRFCVENHLSVRERQELSFAASSLKDRRDGLIPCDAVDSGAVLPAVVIYGANASGKTNFVNAIATMRKFILWSHSKGNPDGGVPRHEFRLDRKCSEQPSRFEMDFVIEGTRFHYGFEATDQEFASEWLYEIPKSHRRKMFERIGSEFDFGRSLKGQNTSIAKLTRANSLFLSAAAQNKHEQLSRIYKYFHDIKYDDSTEVQGRQASNSFDKEGADNRVIDFLKAIDTGVIGFDRNERDVSEEGVEMRKELNALFAKHFGDRIANSLRNEEKMIEIKLAHRGADGETIHLDLDLESAGTRRLLVVLSEAFSALDEGTPIVIDELDVSLHTYASAAVVRLFCSPTVNKKGAQLIATTHDTNLMRSEALRRDQLWFAEKNHEGATEIYPLTDIRTRKGDNFELGYLQGRYGAVPTDDPILAILGS